MIFTCFSYDKVAVQLYQSKVSGKSVAVENGARREENRYNNRESERRGV